MRLVITLCLSVLALAGRAQTQNVQVLEYHPAPGQFVNVLPDADASTTQEEVNRRCEGQLSGDGLVHLGTYGGYITMKFDHPVENKEGSDFLILGNGMYADNDPVYGKATIGGSIEPGIVYVGVGKDLASAQWYELAGSEYYTTEAHDFEITYHKPMAETGAHSQPYSQYDDYIRWECSWTDAKGERRDSTGYHMKNSYHSQSYWPLWEGKDQLTFKGGRLPNNVVEYPNNAYRWIQYRYAKDAYGYADASLNKDQYSTFDIDWAVDEQGNHVDLTEINYIKVVTGIFQYCGWLGETSTEVAGFVDLHLVPGYDDDPIIIPVKQRPTGVASVRADGKDDVRYYDLTGRRVVNPTRGIYISNGKKIMIK